MLIVTFASLFPRNSEENISQFSVCSECQYSDTLGRVPSKIGELWQRVRELNWEGGDHEDQML
jgi:hypothetical protein